MGGVIFLHFFFTFVGWTFTLLSGLTVASMPLIVVEWKCGMRFRRERKEKQEIIGRAKLGGKGGEKTVLEVQVEKLV